MATDKTVYRPLGGKSRALFSLTTATSERLYLGVDHLLYLRNEQFSESYKRFYFRDIQALVMTESTRRNTINIVLLVLAIGGSVLSWMIGAATDVMVAAYLQAGFIVLFGILFAVNAGLGPTCTCYVKTAVHTHALASLMRVRTARKVFDLVNPLITAAQGAAALGQVPTSGLAQTTTVAAPPVIGVPPLAKPPKPVRHEGGRFHALLFLSLLVDSAVTVVDYFVNDLMLTLTSVLLTFAMLALLVTALIRQLNSDIGKTLRGIVWSALGYLALMMVLGYLHLVVSSIEHPEIQSDQWEWIKFVSTQSPQDSLLLMTIYVISILGSFLLGILGLAALFQHWRYRPPAAAGVPPPMN